MKKWQLVIILVVFTTALIYIIPESRLTGQAITDGTFSYTRAICNDANLCEDYIVECKKNTVSKLTPTGFSIQQDLNWIDSRTQKENLCE